MLFTSAKKLSEWMTEQEGALPRHLTVDGNFVKEIKNAMGLASRLCILPEFRYN